MKRREQHRLARALQRRAEVLGREGLELEVLAEAAEEGPCAHDVRAVRRDERQRTAPVVDKEAAGGARKRWRVLRRVSHRLLRRGSLHICA